MKHLIIALTVTTSLAGCKLYTVTQGDGSIRSSSGTFHCVNNIGDCIQQYDEATTETLIATPAQKSAFRRWTGCSYNTIDTCVTTINQQAVDDNLEWQITAVFDEQKPDTQTAQYTYNALGQRITKTVAGKTTVFQYDLDGRLIAELATDGMPIRQHVYLDGEPIALLQRTDSDSEAKPFYIHTDHLATPDLITNENGRIVADFENTPFGVPYYNYSEIDYFIRFPGQYYDEESGLHYNYFRGYAPNIGRYIRTDPIGLQMDYSDPLISAAVAIGTTSKKPSTSLELNHLYSYARSSPLVYFDPYGLAPDWVGPTAAVLGATGGYLLRTPFSKTPAGAVCTAGVFTLAGGLTIWDYATTPTDVPDNVYERASNIKGTIGKINDKVDALNTGE